MDFIKNMGYCYKKKNIITILTINKVDNYLYFLIFLDMSISILFIKKYSTHEISGYCEV